MALTGENMAPRLGSVMVRDMGTNELCSTLSSTMRSWFGISRYVAESGGTVNTGG